MTGGEPNPFGFRFVGPLLIGTLLNPVNSAMIATALVPIGRDLHAGPASTAWLVAGLYLAAAIGQPTMGRIADMYGPRKVAVTGLFLVLVAGLAGALAPDLGMLVFARVLLGLGTSAAYPSAMTMIRARADEAGIATPGTVLGTVVITSQVSAAAGPALGGLLVGSAGWRWIFLVNVPAAALGIVLALLWLPADDPARRARTGALDIVGVVLFAGGLTSLLLFLMRLREHPPYALLGTAVVLLAALVWWELRRQEPFVDVRVLAADRALGMTYLRYALSWLVIYGVVYGFSQWLEDGRGLGPGMTGLLTLPMPVVGAVTAALVSRRDLVRGPMVVGSLAMAGGTLALWTLHASSPVALLVLVNAVLGLPQGLLPVTNQTALYRQAPAAHMGAAAGLLRTSQYGGAILQSSLIGVLFGTHADDAALHRLAPVLAAVGGVLLAVTVADRGLRAVARDPG
jgi:MFS family permease